MEASCLSGGAEVVFPGRLDGRVTMVGLFHRQFGYSMLPSWIEPFEEAFGALGERRWRSLGYISANHNLHLRPQEINGTFPSNLPLKNVCVLLMGLASGKIVIKIGRQSAT